MEAASNADIVSIDTGTKPTKSDKPGLNPVTVGLVIVGIIVLLASLLLLEDNDGLVRTPLSSVVAQSQSLHMTILGRGTVQPARVVPVKSSIESNRARIVWLMDEGERVAAGELVARFDKRPFFEATVLAEQRKRESEARVVYAEKALALAIEETTGQREAAERQVEVTAIEVADVGDGNGRIKLRRHQVAVDKASRTLRIAEVDLTDYKSLHEQGHISKKELAVAEDAKRNAADAFELAEEELRGYELYAWPRQKREADLKLDAARAELARVQRTATLNHQRLTAELRQVNQEAQAARLFMAKTRNELTQTDLRAPIAGTLLHTAIPKAGERRKVQVGDAIWLGQTFLKIPDTSDLDVHLYVRELDVAKLKPGMAARIELDAFAGQTHSGVVTRVANMSSGDANDPNRFLVYVRFSEPPSSVHVGMSANVAIVHEQIDVAVAVPIGALNHLSGNTTVKIKQGAQSWLEKDVILGATDDKWVEIKSGVNAGDYVGIH